MTITELVDLLNQAHAITGQDCEVVYETGQYEYSPILDMEITVNAGKVVLR